MSNPPSGKKKWMCPAHVDWALERRRPKNAPVIETHLRRGHKNNGLIEVENEEVMEFEEVLMSGVVFRLPERGIKLDFIDKVKQLNEIRSGRKRIAEVRISEEPAKRRKITVTQETGLNESDMEAVSALMDLKTHARVAPANEMASLVQNLLAGATTEMAAVFATSGAFAPMGSEMQQLLVLQELIAKRVAEIAPPTPSAVKPITEAPQLKPVTDAPKPVENGHVGIVHSELPNDHQMDDQEFNELMDAETDSAFAVDQEQAVSSSPQSAPIAPMAPMMPVTIAPVAPMAPMAFMKSSK